MRHQTSGPSSVRELALRVNNLERAVRAVSSLPALAYSTVEGGSLDFNDDAGNLRVSIGEQSDGTAAPLVVNGPTPPAVSGVTADSIPQGILVRWDGTWLSDLGVAPLDFSRVEVHISGLGPDFEPELVGDGSLTLQGSISSPRGGRLAATGLGYEDQWVKLIPRTLSGKWGPATPAIGPIAAGRMTQGDFEETVLSAGFVLAGAIQVGDIGQPNPLMISGTEGFVAPQPDGGVIRFPVDGTAARITAAVVAYTLAVKDGFVMAGQGQISGQLLLSDTVRDPVANPAVEFGWPSIQTSFGQGDVGHSNAVQGLTSHHSDPDVLVAAATSQLGTVKISALRLIDKDTGDFAAYPDPTNSQSWVWNFESIAGVARVGTDYFLIGIDHSRQRTYLYRISGTTWSKTGELNLGPVGLYSARPRLTASPTAIAILWVPLDGSLNVHWRSPSTLASLGSPVVMDPMYGGERNLGDAVYGGDPAIGARLWVASRMGDPSRDIGTRVVYCYHPAQPGGPDGEYQFSTASQSQVIGLHYDEAEQRFLSLDNVSQLWRYSKFKTPFTLNAAYTWYDGDNSPYPPGTFIGDTDVSGINSGTRETMKSPTKSVYIPARSWVTIETPPPPDEAVTDPAVVDRANRVGVYVSAGASPLSRYAYLPNTAGVATRVVRDLEVLPAPGAPPPATNSFLNAKAAPGEIQSAASRLDGKPRIQLTGAGEGRFDGLIPPGMMMFWHAPAAPPGWLRSFGQAISRTTYADLFDAVGTTWGTGDGTTTFNLAPDPGLSGIYLVVKV